MKSVNHTSNKDVDALLTSWKENEKKRSMKAGWPCGKGQEEQQIRGGQVTQSLLRQRTNERGCLLAPVWSDSLSPASLMSCLSVQHTHTTHTHTLLYTYTHPQAPNQHLYHNPFSMLLGRVHSVQLCFCDSTVFILFNCVPVTQLCSFSSTVFL